jgi:PKD repeat protein
LQHAVVPELDTTYLLRQICTMRLPWIPQRWSQRAAARRKRSAPLRVRRLERRRVLDAAVTDLVFAPADIDPSTSAHDSKEGAQITVSADASGSGTLTYDWKLIQNANVVAQGNSSTFSFQPQDDGSYSVSLSVTDGDGSTATRTEALEVHNVRPVLVVALDQEVKEGELLDLSAVSGPPLGLYVDEGLLDTHTATVDWGDGSGVQVATVFEAPGAGALGGTHAYTSEGVFEVVVTIADDDGGTDTQSFFVTVGNAAPTATLGNSGPVAEGSSATVSFTNQFDPNPADAAAGFRYAYDVDNDGTFDFGDGTYAGSLASSSQLISSALLADGPSTRTVRARILDLDGGSTDYLTTITVNNVAPTLQNIVVNDATIDEGETATIQMTIYDPGAEDVFSVEVDWKDGAAADNISGLGLTNAAGTVGGTTYSWDAQTRQLTVSHLYEDDNPTATVSDAHAVALVVRDDDMGASSPYSVDVTVANVRPVLFAADQSIDEGELLDLSGNGTPALGIYVDNGVLDTHTATVDWGDGSGVQAATVIPGSASGGTLAGILGGTHTYQDDGVYTATLTITDDDGGVDSFQFEVTVSNVPPVLVVAEDQVVNEGAVLDLSALTGPPLGLYVDPSVLDTHTATVDWGDGSAVESPAIFAASGAGALGGTHTYQDNGVYIVTVTVTDDDGGSDTATFQVVVNNVPPVLVVADDQIVDEGTLLDLSAIGGAPPLGLFVDDGALDTHTATVDWGDGSGVQSATIFAAPGAGAIGGTHTYADDGVYTVTVTVTDDDGATALQTFEVTVSNVMPTLEVVPSDDSIVEGSSVTFDATFSDPGFDNALNPGAEKSESFTYDVDWGDGRDAIVGMSVADLNGGPGVSSTGAFSGSHTYADDGTYTVTVTIHDDDGGSFTREFIVTVENAAPVLVPPANQTVNEGATLSLANLGTFTDGGFDNPLNPGAEKAETFTYDVEWGDGRDPITGASIADTNGGPGVPSSGTISGSHIYADNGTYTVTVTIYDDDGGSDTATFEVTVNNVQPTLEVTPTTTSILEGGSVDFNATFSDPGFDNPLNPGAEKQESFTYDVDWGDGRDAISGMSVADLNGGPGVDSTGAFNGSHTYADDGTYTVTVTIHDDDGDSFVQQFVVTVSNAAPTLTLPNGDQAVNEGALLSLANLGTFSDAGFDNPLNSGAEKAETFIYDVDWGDGRDAITGASVADLNGSPGVPSTGTIAGSHTYADDGTYTVTVTIYDDDGGSDTKTFEVVVSNVQPTLAVTPSPTSINEGQTVSFDASFSDPGFDNPLNSGAEKSESFTYDVDWGDGRDAIAGQSVSDTNGGPSVDSTGSFSGSHTYADDGTYTVTITIRDDNGGVDTKSFQVVVANVKPTLDVTPSPTSINEGQTVSFDAMFRDPGFDNSDNPGAEKAESFTYDVNWGDGRNTVSGQAVADTNGGPGVDSTGTFDGSHVYADDGTYTVTVTIYDDDGGVDTRTFNVVVTNVAPSLTGTSNVVVNEGQVITLGGLGVGLTDPGFDNPNNPTTPPQGDPVTESFLGYQINWGDGSTPDDLSVVGRLSDLVDGPTTATFTSLNRLLSRMDHAYADNGTYTVTIRLADDNMAAFANPALFADNAGEGTNYVDVTFTITVNNVVPTLTLPNGNLPSGGQTILESQTISLVNLGVITDNGFNNPTNPNAAAGGSVETFRYWVDWNDNATFDTADTAAATIDDVGGFESLVVDLTDGSFDGSHTFADNGTYTVRVRVADDDMGAFGNLALFENGQAGVDYVELTFTVVVTNAGPSFTPQPNGDAFAGNDLDQNGLTTIFVAYNDPGYDNPNNTFSTNGGETVETFNHVVQWGDGTVDAIHQYTTSGTFDVTVTMTIGGVPQSFTFNNFSSTNPVLNLVSSQQLNDPSVVPTLVTYEVDWGDGHVETFQLSLLNPGVPGGTNGLTTLVASTRASGNASMPTTGSAAVQHTYLGPPDPLHPTADIIITLAVYDDDGGNVTSAIAVTNPGITGTQVAIDTTPDVPRLDLTIQPMTDVFIADQGGLTQLFQVPDVRGGGGETAATTERYLELRVVNPDGTESDGIKIKDEALADLRAFFKTLPDGRYRIYLVRTENNSARLVIEVDVRHGRVIDVSDDSEGTRDRPPTEEEAPPAVPLDQNPLLENQQGEVDTNAKGEVAEQADQDAESISGTSPVLVSAAAAALVFQPWSRRVDEALAGADENAWKRLRRAGRMGRAGRPSRLTLPTRTRATDNLDYNNTRLQ